MHTKKRYTFESRCDVVKKNHSSPPALNAGQTKTGLPPQTQRARIQEVWSPSPISRPYTSGGPLLPVKIDVKRKDTAKKQAASCYYDKQGQSGVNHKAIDCK